MKSFANCAKPVLVLLCILVTTQLHAQGPPYQTDDPVPVDFHHYEFYIFGGVDGTTRAEVLPLFSPGIKRPSQPAVERPQ